MPAARLWWRQQVLAVVVPALLAIGLGLGADAPAAAAAAAAPAAVFPEPSRETLAASATPHRVAWAVPVGGKTVADRTAYLSTLLGDFIRGGVRRADIFVFEDDGSRRHGEFTADPRLRATASAAGVHLVRSHVIRARPGRVPRGLHLSRHYKFMLDWLLDGRVWRPEPGSPVDTKVPAGTHDWHGGGAAEGAAVAVGAAETPPAVPYDFVVIVEDDLQLAGDVVRYFHKMAAVMHADDSLFCVSGRADNAFFPTSQDPTLAQLRGAGDADRGEYAAAAAAAGGAAPAAQRL